MPKRNIIPSANRTAGAYPSADQSGEGVARSGARKPQVGVIVHLDITVAGGTAPTLDVKVQKKTGAGYVDVPGAAFVPKVAAGQDYLIIYPGIVELANKKVSTVLGDDWRVLATVGGGVGANFTFSVDVEDLS